MNTLLASAASLALSWPFVSRPQLGEPGCGSLKETELRAACIRGAFFFESKELSFDTRASCASCHQPAQRGGQLRFLDDGRPRPFLRGSDLVRNRTPSLLDVGWKALSWQRGGAASFFWNGRSHKVESVSFWPLLAADELGVRLLDAEVFGGIDAVAKELGVFLGTQRSGPAPFDEFLSGDAKALSAVQKDGLNAFMNAGCPECHGGQELNELQNQKQKRAELRYADLPRDFFFEGEAVYSADAALAAKPAKKIVLQSVPQTLRNLSVHVSSFRYFGRFGQAASLSDFLELHCEQFLEMRLKRSCKVVVRNKPVFATLIEFLQNGLRSREFDIPQKND